MSAICHEGTKIKNQLGKDAVYFSIGKNISLNQMK